MEKQLHNFISQEKLFNKTAKILIAISGGADSIVLLDLLINTGYSCAIAHCNFKLRGQESEKDALFVENLSKKYDLKYFYKEFNTKKYSTQNKISIEMAARELRYEWFEKIRKENNYDFIATAHHKNDSVETFLLNITRGTGIRGLTGIPAKNNYIVRPLLFADKNNILEYCETNKIIFRTDKTNFQSDYNRNKIRNKIIPFFEEINPAFNQNVSQNIEKFKEIEKIYSKEILREKNNCVSYLKEDILININKLKKIEPIKTYLYEFLLPYNFSPKIIEDIILSLNNISGKKFFSQTHRLVKDRENLIISKQEQSIVSDCKKSIICINENQNKITFDNQTLEIKNICITPNFKIKKTNSIAYIDADNIQFPLIIRKWTAGDYFFPLGMNKAKKLSDFFIDEKFSLPDKENTWLLLSEKKIIWIIGQRIDNRFRITNKTEKCLFLRNINF